MQLFPAYHDVRAFGAVGDGIALDTAALQQAIDACHGAGGGTVVVPAGTYLTGTLYLKSHVTLHLTAGAVLRGSSRREDYNPDDIFPENPVFTTENVTGAHLIIAYQQDCVAITGEGTIDGNSGAFFEALPEAEVTTTYRRKARNFPIGPWRPGQMVFFCRCTNVSVRDVSLVDSPYWTLLLLGCDGVRIRGLRITNPPQTANGDGIDLDCCRDVTVSDCVIHSGDDSITLRGHSRLLGEHAQPCENVVITNCVLSTPCNAIRIGVGDGVVRNCTLSNIIVKESRTGLSIVSAYSERTAHGVTIENLHLSNFLIDAVMPWNMLLGEHAKRPAQIRNLSFSHFRALAREGSYIGGNPGHPVQDIHLHDIDLRLTGGEVNPNLADLRATPCGTNGVPAGLLARHVQGLRIEGLRVSWEAVTGPWQHGLVIEECEQARLSGLDVTSPPTAPDAEALLIRDVSGPGVAPN
ncbi:MAG: glycosyl hydrolase family 28 protein [Armatimonadia bacterium]